MYALQIGFRYLRSKKQSSVSVITGVAVVAVALGVASLLCVLSVTSGFQDVFRSKVLGVNAHVLIRKYGIGSFTEYRDVIASAEEMDEVEGAAPFMINEMMMAAGDRLSNVLVKGIDPDAMQTVLDLPKQIVDGELVGLRLAGRTPPENPARFDDGTMTELERYLKTESDAWDREAGESVDATRTTGSEDTPTLPEVVDQAPGELPEVQVPTLAQASEALERLEADDGALPDDAFYDDLFEDDGASDVPIGELPGVILGQALAERLDAQVGDRVSIISPLAGLDTSAWRAETQTPASEDFRVIAIFHAGFQEYDTRLAYVDLYEAQRFFQQGDTVMGVELRLYDMDSARSVAREIEDNLGGTPYHTMDWAKLNQNLFTALRVQKVVLSIAIASIIVVAALGVIATLFMMVLEKKREIAILKAMGARNHSILGIFLVQGTVIGFVGTILGLLLGGGAIAYLAHLRFPLDPKVYLIDHLPVRVSSTEFILTSVVACLICAIATIVPSWFASRLLPADGVRYE